MLQIHDVAFVRATSDPDWHPDPARPEIAFVGRSNVGKSSLLNTLCRRKKLAHTSKTPGKTRSINYFDVGGACYFVDLPGYGYAKRPVAERGRWGPMMESYLGDNERLAGVVSLIDGRHDPTDLDERMIEYLSSREIPTLVVLTKADKVGRGKRADRLERTAGRLGADPDQMVWFSSLTGEGRDEVFTAIAHLIESEAA